MRSATVALTWEIWSRKRGCVAWLLGIISFASLFNLLLPASFSATEAGKTTLGILNSHLSIASLLFVLAIFSYTEFNPQKDSACFPHRLFTLPVTSFRLVAVPMLLGVAAGELVLLVWVELGFSTPGESVHAVWMAVLIGAYMVFYQTILWTLAGLRSLRMIVPGLIAIVFIMIAFLPRPWWFSETFLTALFVGSAVIAFLTSWIYVARQRSGGGSRRRWLNTLACRLSDAFPKRDRIFSSPAAAQLWFEWRRSGLVLPLLIAGLLIVVFGPVSWQMRNEAASTLRILLAAFAMPIILAAPFGKAFSKPDFWSGDLAFPAFLAARPMTAADMVIIKMKVAALSAAISWLLVLAFLSTWLPLWANLDSLATIRLLLWQIYGHSLYPQYAIAALSIAAGVLLTWRFLVGSLWLGLSGERTLFAASAIPYAFLPVVGLIGLLVLFRRGESLLAWLRTNADGLLPAFVWIAALAVIAKFWTAAFCWSKMAPHHVRQYLLVWFGSTLCLTTLSVLLWAGLRYVLPSDIYRLRSLLVLVSLLIIPLARVGLAPSSLARNRHR